MEGQTVNLSLIFAAILIEGQTMNLNLIFATILIEGQTLKLNLIFAAILIKGKTVKTSKRISLWRSLTFCDSISVLYNSEIGAQNDGTI